MLKYLPKGNRVFPALRQIKIYPCDTDTDPKWTPGVQVNSPVLDRSFIRFRYSYMRERDRERERNLTSAREFCFEKSHREHFSSKFLIQSLQLAWKLRLIRKIEKE